MAKKMLAMGFLKLHGPITNEFTGSRGQDSMSIVTSALHNPPILAMIPHGSTSVPDA